jgi:hypothetical protein
LWDHLGVLIFHFVSPCEVEPTGNEDDPFIQQVLTAGTCIGLKIVYVVRSDFRKGLVFTVLWLLWLFLLRSDLAQKTMCETHDLVQSQIAIDLTD